MYKPPDSTELENRLKLNRERLNNLQNEIKLPYDIPTLKEKGKEREDDLKHYKDKWFECM